MMVHQRHTIPIAVDRNGNANCICSLRWPTWAGNKETYDRDRVHNDLALDLLGQRWPFSAGNRIPLGWPLHENPSINDVVGHRLSGEADEATSASKARYLGRPHTPQPCANHPLRLTVDTTSITRPTAFRPYASREPPRQGAAPPYKPERSSMPSQSRFRMTCTQGLLHQSDLCLSGCNFVYLTRKLKLVNNV